MLSKTAIEHSRISNNIYLLIVINRRKFGRIVSCIFLSNKKKTSHGILQTSTSFAAKFVHGYYGTSEHLTVESAHN